MDGLACSPQKSYTNLSGLNEAGSRPESAPGTGSVFPIPIRGEVNDKPPCFYHPPLWLRSFSHLCVPLSSPPLTAPLPVSFLLPALTTPVSFSSSLLPPPSSHRLNPTPHRSSATGRLPLLQRGPPSGPAPRAPWPAAPLPPAPATPISLSAFPPRRQSSPSSRAPRRSSSPSASAPACAPPRTDATSPQSAPGAATWRRCSGQGRARAATRLGCRTRRACRGCRWGRTGRGGGDRAREPTGVGGTGRPEGWRARTRWSGWTPVRAAWGQGSRARCEALARPRALSIHLTATQLRLSDRPRLASRLPPSSPRHARPLIVPTYSLRWAAIGASLSAPPQRVTPACLFLLSDWLLRERPGLVVAPVLSAHPDAHAMLHQAGLVDLHGESLVSGITIVQVAMSTLNDSLAAISGARLSLVLSEAGHSVQDALAHRFGALWGCQRCLGVLYTCEYHSVLHWSSSLEMVHGNSPLCREFPQLSSEDRAPSAS